MNSREIIERTLNYACPQRVAHSFDESDFVFCGYTCNTHTTEWKQLSKNKWERIDEWGNRWQRLDATSHGEVVEGVLKKLSDIDSYEFPDFSALKDYESAREKAGAHVDKWTVGTLPGFTFNIARKLFKLENYLCNLVLETTVMHNLHDRIDKLLMDMIDGYAYVGVDSLMFGEDWGTQHQPLISPALWHKEFYPRFKTLCAYAHERQMKVFMHSCGAITPLIPGIIRSGIDVLQFDQPLLHGIDQLADYQKDHQITFWCPVDIQKTLQTKDKTLIQAEAKEMIDKLWKKRGGFIAGFYTDNASIGIENKWQEYAIETFLKYGRQDV